MNYDITFCIRKCYNVECKRNILNAPLSKEKRFISMSDFTDCKFFKEENTKEEE